MAKSRLDRMREMAGEIKRRNEEFAKTPAGEEIDIRMEFATRLLKNMKARGITKTALCQRIGMKPPQFTLIIQGETNVTISMIGRIAKGIGVPPSRLLPSSKVFVEAHPSTAPASKTPPRG